MEPNPLVNVSRMRADAARNRECLIAAARERFTAGNTMLSLEGVAQAAEVGIGTLYRHFPTREAWLKRFIVRS